MKKFLLIAVAAFGMFTNISYETKQKDKNKLGRLAYFHLAGQDTPFPGDTMKVFYMDMPLEKIELIEEGKKKKIESLLGSASGCHVLHTVTYTEGLGGFEIETEFINDSGKDVSLDMLTSFTID